MTEEDIKKLQSTGGEALAATEKNILGNNIEELWDLVGNLKGGRVDFVLDNAGFELYCDMVYGALSSQSHLIEILMRVRLADFLIQSGLVKTVHFHGKRLPWFVSDVTRKDWNWLINSCVYGHLFPTVSEGDLASLRTLGERWKSYERSGQWVYEQHPF